MFWSAYRFRQPCFFGTGNFFLPSLPFSEFESLLKTEGYQKNTPLTSLITTRLGISYKSLKIQNAFLTEPVLDASVKPKIG